ncbi:MAG: ChrR family anti-sigma-E factor, partial [Rhodanobacter sp.]
TLLSYSAGALPTALAVVASAHLERCAMCRQQLLDADQIGGMLMQQQRVDTPTDHARAAMLARLDDALPIEPMALPVETVEARNPDRLPSALHPWFGHSMRALRWRRVAPGVQRILA